MSKDFYCVYSLNVASYLVMNGFEIVKTDRDDSNKVVMYFDNTTELHKFIARYHSEGKLKQFITAHKKVKDIIIKNK